MKQKQFCRAGAVLGFAGSAAIAFIGAAGATGLNVGPDEVFGANPSLVAPKQKLIPTVNIAKAVGWPEGAKPIAPAGLQVEEFASGLDHPRWLYQLPNGDVLVAESNRPNRTDMSLMGWITSFFLAKAGAGGDSPDRIIRLADTDGDGKADKRSVFLEDLHSPFGMALIGDNFYVANADAIVRFKYQTGAESLAGKGDVIAALPAGRNHHWTKNILPSKDGTKLFVTVGSNSNIAENGMDEEENRAAVLEVTIATGETRLFAGGLRNPNGLDFKPGTNELWTVVNERDLLGDNLVPDYVTSVKDGAFYGWPYSYFGHNVDTRVKPQKPDLVAKAIAPDYAVGAHTASLGLAFSTPNALGASYASGAFIGQHGSWNRRDPAGYRVLFVPFADGKPSGAPSVVLAGFLDDKGDAMGRPVGVIVAKGGGILVADDVGNRIWRITKGTATNRD